MPKSRKRLFLACSFACAITFVLGAFWYRGEYFPYAQLLAWKSKALDEPSRAGRWKVATQPSGAAADNEEAIRKLQSLGYVSGSQKAPTEAGITLYDEALAYDGLNLVVSGHAPEATLMTLSGRVVHKWSCDARKAWPDFKIEDRVGPNKTQLHTFWRRAHVLDNGDLLAIFEGLGLIRLDKDSNVIWAVQNGAHHDLHLHGDRIYVLTRKAHVNPNHNPDRPILEDFITVLDQDGTQLQEVSILDVLKNSNYATLAGRLKSEGDIFHSNTIEIMEEKNWDRPLPWKPGLALVSILYLDLVCLIDLEKQAIVWAESDLWRMQHQPTVLDNGNLLVLNNYATAEASSVIEWDPVSNDRVWYYGPETGDFFRTKTIGTAQRLPNGNTLITESDPGRAFEVTPGKTIVWEYVNPQRAGERKELIATLLEVVRLEASFSDTLARELD